MSSMSSRYWVFADKFPPGVERGAIIRESNERRVVSLPHVVRRWFMYGNIANWLTAATLFFAGVLSGVTVEGQRGGSPEPPSSPKAAAPVDLTGYWVSLITEDWRYRVLQPPKGDYIGVPLNPAGRKAADAWDPAQDEATDGQCRAYGVGGVMRMPGRLHITWQDDDTIKLETDAGTQVRLLAFGAPRGQGNEWQGLSVASWDRSASVMGAGGIFPSAVARGGSLKVVTTKMKAGYLRKNGVPYSANAVITEYFDRFDVPAGDSLLVVSTEVVDPAYLVQPFWTSTHFKRQNDASGWSPTPCSAR
ncbi:MAG: hypothetical protein C5B57_10785 [Blastocatellia bacterium]|nr:MAG: hypothetical protein C5B57_10785 [Blastocatellia bacterium]